MRIIGLYKSFAIFQMLHKRTKTSGRQKNWRLSENCCWTYPYSWRKSRTKELKIYLCGCVCGPSVLSPVRSEYICLISAPLGSVDHLQMCHWHYYPVLSPLPNPFSFPNFSTHYNSSKHISIKSYTQIITFYTHWPHLNSFLKSSCRVFNKTDKLYSQSI